MKTLIVVDVQNDFVTGPLGTPEAQAIIPNIKKKIEEYEVRGDEIIFTQDCHFENYLNTNEGKHLPVEHCIYGTDGYKIVDGLNDKAHYVYVKFTFGSLNLRNVITIKPEEIEFVGLCTDVCVITNVLILKTRYPNIEITVDASCCAGTMPEKHKAALEILKSCQINVNGE